LIEVFTKDSEQGLKGIKYFFPAETAREVFPRRGQGTRPER